MAFMSMSYTEPRAIYRVQAKTGTVQKTGLAAVSVADFSGVDVTREACTSSDGTKVPITILRAKAKAGPTQALLTGYGGFGDSLLPRFRTHTLTWIEQGGVYAVANLRGGSELERTGTPAVTSPTSRTSSTTSTRALSTSSWPGTRRPTGSPSSADRTGGLLMGAEFTQHPEAWKAVVAMVGISQLRVERDPNGAFNVTEYGTVNDPAQFDALHAYSPYHHVKDGGVPGGAPDDRRNDPRRAVPLAQDDWRGCRQRPPRTPPSCSGRAQHGHGIGSPLAAQIEETTDSTLPLPHARDPLPGGYGSAGGHCQKPRAAAAVQCYGAAGSLTTKRAPRSGVGSSAMSP